MGIKFKQSLLLLGDIIALYLALFFMILIRFQRPILVSWQQHFWLFTFLFIIWLLIFYIAGFYNITTITRRINLSFLWGYFKILIINVLLAMSFFYIIPHWIENIIAPKRNILVVLLIFFILDINWRYFVYRLLKFRRMINNLAFIGINDGVNEIVKKIENYPGFGYKLSLIIASIPLPNQFTGVKFINNIPDVSTLQKIFNAENIKIIVIVQDSELNKELVHKFYQCLPLKINFVDFTAFYENLTGKIPIHLIKKIWFLGNLKEAQKRSYDKLKRFVDILYVLILGSIFIVILPFIALVIKLNSTGPVFYKQKRIGRNGQVFELIKFRSMIKGAEKNGAQWWQENDCRVTRVGSFLRGTHIDELPQIINILKGEMSLVGPRPERPEFVEKLTKSIPYYQIRHLVKPGITGWAQVNFRYGSSVEDALEKLQYDIYYIKNRSMLLDMSIILRTINTIFKKI